METAEVLIIGGGPAGSSCAWRLSRHGIDAVVLEAKRFPRTKLCAGWITPQVVGDLELDISSYPHSFLTFEHIHVHLRGFGFKLESVQHSIRRYEFDDWLLKRSTAQVLTHNASNIRKENGYYIVDDQYRSRYLVGAGGTRCPVYRRFFRESNPRIKALQAVTLEQEFPYDWKDGDCHLWFFDQRLPGYSWYVPKSNGYLNVGIGAMAKKLKRRGDDIKRHWGFFTQTLKQEAFVPDYDYKATGYSYYLRDAGEIGRVDNAFVIGDAAGLATRDLCEGIGAAVRSGILAADAIAKGENYSLSSVRRFSADNALARRFLEFMFIGPLG